jgi:hypothetical protein
MSAERTHSMAEPTGKLMIEFWNLTRGIGERENTPKEQERIQAIQQEMNSRQWELTYQCEGANPTWTNHRKE